MDTRPWRFAPGTGFPDALLEAILNGGLFADFRLLWLLLHYSRLDSAVPAECWLEKWHKAAASRGKRALESLRDGVRNALEALGHGFVAHPDNRRLREALRSGELTPRDYYTQLLRLVYRLIFLCVSEDRDLLLIRPETQMEDSERRALLEARELYRKHYSLERLRRMANRQRGSHHPDLWHMVRKVMTLLSQEGCSGLALPALGSRLWSSASTPNLNDAELANCQLLDALRALAFLEDRNSRRPVDFRNLGSRELGSVYESLLELTPEINLSTPSFSFVNAAGHDRKTTGSYYTPDELVENLLDSALNPVIELAVRGKKADESKKAILALRVIDPACGSGHFLLAAAHRLAHRLALITTQGSEPSPEEHRHAMRQIVGTCIYGVDLNELAVELCRFFLWLEALEPGRPLTFLDSHVKYGNSLLSATPGLIAQGLPDAALAPLEGDDTVVCNEGRKRNRKEREKEGSLFASVGAERSSQTHLEKPVEWLESLSDDDIRSVLEKETLYDRFQASPEYRAEKLLADAWCAAFVWPKSAENGCLTTDTLYRLQKDPLSISEQVKEQINRLSGQYRFFHWHVEFPRVFKPRVLGPKDRDPLGWTGGFDVVLGNPPWERVKIQEKEWFATRAPDIAQASNASARKKLIADLAAKDETLYQAWLEAQRQAEGESRLLRDTGRFPLCGRGDVNTFAVFAELDVSLVGDRGFTGFIVPSGIATDDTTKLFFQNLMDSGTLVSLFDFENRSKLFPEVDSRMRFSLLTVGSLRNGPNEAVFCFHAHTVEDVVRPDKRFRLSAAEIALLNPNTRTCPVFRSGRDAELTKTIYRNVPVLIEEGPPEVNGWGISFQAMLHMANDSSLFKTERELTRHEYEVHGNIIENESGRYLPLYEAKLLHHFTHRFGDYRDQPKDSHNTSLPDVPVERLKDPDYCIWPRYWVPESEVLERLPLWLPPPIKRLWKERQVSGNAAELGASLLTWAAGYALAGNDDPTVPRAWLKALSDRYSDAQATIGKRRNEDDSFLEIALAWQREFPLGADEYSLLAPLCNQATELLIQGKRLTGLGEDSAHELLEHLVEVRRPRWMMGWRDICRNTDERTVIASVLPVVACGDTVLLMFPLPELRAKAAFLITNLCSLVLDFAARQKVGGTHLKYHVFKQLPILPPSAYDAPCPLEPDLTVAEWLRPRVLELAYTSWDLKPFAEDLGYEGAPFSWDEQRRFQLRAEIDRLFFRLYRISEADAAYILETFPIVKRHDESAWGTYRTKTAILSGYGEEKRPPLSVPTLETAAPTLVRPAPRLSLVPPLQELPVIPQAESLPAGVTLPALNLEAMKAGSLKVSIVGRVREALAAALRALGGSGPAKEVRLLHALVLYPELAVPLMEDSQRQNWWKLLGMKPGSVTRKVSDRDFRLAMTQARVYGGLPLGGEAIWSAPTLLESHTDEVLDRRAQCLASLIDLSSVVLTDEGRKVLRYVAV